MEHEERALRLVRRIESFSDLVIGFSLALLALTLTIPPHFVDLGLNQWWLIAYAWTFIVISTLWFQHQRLFSHYFTPHPATIILNFTALGLIGLIVFFVQVFVHYHTEAERVWSVLAYFSVLGLTLMAFGILYAHGVRARWSHLDDDLRFTGVRYALRGFMSGGCMLLGVIICVAREAKAMSDIFPLVALAIFGVFAARLTARAFKQRIMGAADA